MSSNQYSKLISAFKTLGYSQTSQLQQYEINKAMDRISQSAGIQAEFDREVSQQLWDHTQKQNGNTVILRDYIQSVIDALNVLKEHIQSTQQKLKHQNNPADREELQADLLSYVNDHKILTQPFNLPNVSDSKAIQQSRASFSASKGNLGFPSSPAGGDMGWARTSQIFTMAPSSREESWSLKIVFVITAVLIGVELFIMFHKNHFFNLLGYTMIMLIFAQNFFDKTYMRITIVWVAVSIVLDFLWLIVHSQVILLIIQNWWNPYAQTQHSTIMTGYLRFSYFLVICTMLAKILITILMVRYFNNDESIRKSVSFFKMTFKLDGRSGNNPITQALTGNKAGFAGVQQENPPVSW